MDISGNFLTFPELFITSIQKWGLTIKFSHHSGFRSFYKYLITEVKLIANWESCMDLIYKTPPCLLFNLACPSFDLGQCDRCTTDLPLFIRLNHIFNYVVLYWLILLQYYYHNFYILLKLWMILISEDEFDELFLTFLINSVLFSS